MLISILFIVAIAFCFFSFLSFKSANSKADFFAAIPIRLWVMLSAMAVLYTTISIVGLKVNILSGTVIAFLIGLLLLIYNIKNGFQKYEICWSTVISFAVICTVTIFLALNQFDAKLYPFYETSDPSVHLLQATQILNTGKLQNMFFAPLFNASIFETVLPFYNYFELYKVFVLSDIFMFAFSGVFFYAILTSFTDDVRFKVCGLVITLFYIIGYPFNNMVFGFVYLGMGVTAVVATLYFSYKYANNSGENKGILLALMLCLYTVSETYILFAPATYFAVFFLVTALFLNKKKLFSLKYISEQLKIFLLPTVLTLYCYFLLSEPTKLSALSTEGYIYKNLFADFIFLIAPVIFVVINSIRQKKTEPTLFFLFVFGLQAFVTLYFTYARLFSTYYYYKIYFPLSAICFIIAFTAICSVGKKDFIAILSYILSVSLLFGVRAWDKKIYNKRPEISSSLMTTQLFNIYEFNKSKNLDNLNEKNINIWNLKLELYRYVYDNCNIDTKSVYMISGWEDLYWYRAITGQELKYLNSQKKVNKYLSKSDYAVVIKQENPEYVINYRYETVFENDIGYVAKIKQ